MLLAPPLNVLGVAHPVGEDDEELVLEELLQLEIVDLRRREKAGEGESR